MLQEIIVLTVAYIVLIGLFQPSKKKTVAPIADPAASIDYFPEPEEVTTTERPKTLSEPVQKAIAATALSPVKIATAKPEPVQGFRPDLSKMGVRQLYRLASDAGIKGYKRLSKAQLIEALA